MKLDKSIAVFAMVASLMLAVGATAAQTSLQDSNPDQATTSNVQNLSEFDSTAGDTLTLDGGNVTDADLQAEQTSDDWAGIYGEASGSISLGTGNSNKLYTWSGAQALHVFAVDTDRSEPSWSSLDNASVNNVSNSYTSLSSPTGAGDTYNETATIDFGTFTGTKETVAAQTNSAGGDDWNTTVLRDDDGTDYPIFHVEARSGSTSFNGDTADYQMIVPAPNDAPNSYNMYVELG